MASPYKTNFHKEKSGNSLEYGKDLTITIDHPTRGDPIYVAGMLYKRKSFGRKQAIQAEQTGRKSNPSKNSITFEMKNPDGTQLPQGNYRVETRWSFGHGDLGIEENFEIV